MTGFVLASAIETEQSPQETPILARVEAETPAIGEAAAVDEALRRLGTVGVGAALVVEPGMAAEEIRGPAPSPMSETDDA